MSINSGLENDDLQAYLDTLNKDIIDVSSETSTIMLNECDTECDMNGRHDVKILTKLNTLNSISNNNNNSNTNDNHDADDLDVEVADGTIIMDVDGNYYFQTSKGTVSVEPLPKEKATKTVLARSLTVKAATRKSNKEKKTAGQANLKNVKTTKHRNQKVSPTTRSRTKTSNANHQTIKQTITADIIKKEPNSSAIFVEDDGKAVVEETITEDKVAMPAGEQKSIETKVKVVKDGDNNKNDSSMTFKCPLCKYSTTKKFLYSRHCKTHSDERPYKCSVCERGFKTNASLLNHVNTHLGNKPHKCTDCEKRFTTSGELVRHVRYCHTGFKPHKCTECDYCSVEMSKLKRHMRCHTGERPYQCPHCTYASPDTFKLKRHLRTHTGEKPYECDICHARFTQSNSLKHHRLIHLVNEKPVFQCSFCPTTCGRKTDLRLHVQKLHTTDKPWPCNRCGKELPDRYSYKMHVKTHDGEKCYKCKYCPYASTTQRHLQSHILMHTDEKPFICSICTKSFRQKQLLSRHVNLYHNDNYRPPPPRAKLHACPYCDRSFTFKGNLMRHMELHDDTHLIQDKDQIELGLDALNRIESDGATIIAYSSDDDNDTTTILDHNDDDETNIKQIVSNLNEDSIQFIYEEVNGKNSTNSTNSTNSINSINSTKAIDNSIEAIDNVTEVIEITEVTNSLNTVEQSKMKSENSLTDFYGQINSAADNTDSMSNTNDKNKKQNISIENETKPIIRTLDIKSEVSKDALMDLQIDDEQEIVVLEVIQFDDDDDDDDDDEDDDADADNDDSINNGDNNDDGDIIDDSTLFAV